MAPAKSDTKEVLAVESVSVRFGGVQALADVSLAVPEGGSVGLIGPNGAGKTTLFNCISGFVRPQKGTIRFRHRDITRQPPHHRSLTGIARTFQNVGLCAGESVLQNVLIAQHPHIAYAAVPGMLGLGTRTREAGLRAKALEVLDSLGLAERRADLVGDLPIGTAKLVELACALCADPELLLLDEPSSGLGPDEASELGETLARFRQDHEVAILIIGHDIPLVMSTASYVYVMNFGKLLAEGTPADIRSNPEVISAYLGGQRGPRREEAKRRARKSKGAR